MPSTVFTPTFTVRIAGAELTEREANAVHEIKITDWLRLPDVCTVAVGYQADETRGFADLDGSAFKVGAELEVKLGSTEETTTQTLFKGEIVTVEPTFQAGHVAMVVRAYDRSHRMMRSRKQRTFLNQTISDIVKKVAADSGIRVSGASSGAPLDFVLQHNETDWDFVWRLAKRIGFEFICDDTQAEFKKPNPNAESVSLTYPDDLYEFRPRLTAVQQVEKVIVRGFDLKAKKSVTRTKTTPEQVTSAGIQRSEMVKAFPGASLEIAGQSFNKSEEADSMAQAALDQLANAYLAAEGACFGDPRIKAGVKLEVKGIGSKYSGTYRVAKAVHSISGGGGYTTTFSNSVGEHTLLGQTGGGNGGPASIDSIVVAVVTNNNDPDKLGRVRVKFPSLTEQESFWAPVLLPAAGKERGISMLPVPDEQVLVAFENGDPSFPYVLGSVFNGKDKPGDEMAVADGSFAMKSDHKALIAAQEDIKLRTEKGKWIIEVNSGEITETVKSPGNYTGTFDGKWNVTASQAITVESKQGVTIKAPSITLEAQGSLSLKGATVTVEAQSQLQLKGAQVSVNGSAMVAISGGLINIG
jgi:phage protein D/phage baseplate assembly protein gpV